MPGLRTILPEIKKHNRLLPSPFLGECSGEDLQIVKSHCQFSVLISLDLAVALETQLSIPPLLEILYFLGRHDRSTKDAGQYSFL